MLFEFMLPLCMSGAMFVFVLCMMMLILLMQGRRSQVGAERRGLIVRAVGPKSTKGHVFHGNLLETYDNYIILYSYFSFRA